ncbi:epsin-2 isoform X1 [Salmo salar]|uniref:Epsin-2 isoform X1 n=1 Tax=Salmo salar TaxID=8030 RepID=A0ABM3E9U4_SALSA|nr:epsin-2-like isoform X1 [Salmo salar]
MPSSTIRRSVKNMVNNYSDAEKKVRESTSNDPWGPSSSLMSEVADLTYNVVAFSEIMSMIWRRLNDHGKNWRHVYKALTLLDYLIKTGSERVALQCKENIFAIQTLKDFQYIDRDGKDQGINVREKSKQLVVLLKDEERLKGERSQALKTKERMAQVTTTGAVTPGQGFGRGSSQPNLSTSYSEEYGKSEGSPASYHGSTSPVPGSELEQARPQTSGEEELQLQLALAMSREAAEQEDRMRRGDDLRLQMALEESRKGKALGDTGSGKLAKKKREQAQSSLLDLMDVPEGDSSDPWGAGGAAAPPDPWQAYGAAPKPVAPVDPWGPPSSSVAPMKSSDPWGTNAAPDPWGSGGTRPNATYSGDGRGLSSLTSGTEDLFDPLPSRKTPESFLGPNAALVNLDSLVTKPPQPAPVVNPFLAAAVPVAAPQANPFQMGQPNPPTLNQMRISPMPGLSLGGGAGFSSLSSMVDPLPLSSLPPPQPLGMVPLTGHMVPGIGGMGGIPTSVSMSQPLFSSALPPTAGTHPPGTTNPFLL